MASLLTSVSSAASVSAVPVSAACDVSSAAAAVSAAGVCVEVPPHAVSPKIMAAERIAANNCFFISYSSLRSLAFSKINDLILIVLRPVYILTCPCFALSV